MLSIPKLTKHVGCKFRIGTHSATNHRVHRYVFLCHLRHPHGRWMTSTIYIICTIIAMLVVIVFAKSLIRWENAWLTFDTFGLALFTIAGLQKTLQYDYPFWVAIIMGCITGVAGGIIRDVLLNQEPVIFQKDIYAMASVAGGLLYWLLFKLEVNVGLTSIATFLAICCIRFLAIKYHISLPILRDEIKDHS